MLAIVSKAQFDFDWLAANPLMGEGVAAIGSSLQKNSILTSLNLSSVKAGREGASGISQCLQFNTTLRWLRLVSNELDINALDDIC